MCIRDRAHIDYILDRIDLFLDLELLQVDEENFWTQLYDESYQPERRVLPPAGTGPAYGRLPQRVWYSDCIRRMDCIPFGPPRVFDSNSLSNEVTNPGVGGKQPGAVPR